MKLIAEYLEHALSFEQLAADEQNPTLKKDFEKQAVAYHKLAVERTKKLGLQPPQSNWDTTHAHSLPNPNATDVR